MTSGDQTPGSTATSRHVMIYGPPAVGKLTVARQLEARYGLRVLDNHVSIDPALRLFDFGTPAFQRLVEELRVALIGAAAREGVSVVSTLVYAGGLDEPHVAALLDAAEAGGAEVVRVRLLAPAELLSARVQAADRRGTRKITDPAVLQRLLASYDVTTAYHPDDLTLDAATLSPVELADRIADHAGLGPVAVAAG